MTDMYDEEEKLVLSQMLLARQELDRFTSKTYPVFAREHGFYGDKKVKNTFGSWAAGVEALDAYEAGGGARGRLGERERVGDMNQLREEADTWAPTRKAANRHLLDDEPIYVNGKIGGGMDGQPVNHKNKARGPALTSEQGRTIAAHEQAYREMGEQQAETRDARRDRAMNRPRGQAGTDEDAE